MQAHAQFGRINSYHSPKRQLLGNNAGAAAPAWKINQQAVQRKASGSSQGVGSKILLSRLPMDVGEEEVEALFQKTIGPVKEVFLVYNSTGKSKGMAVVSFQRPGDALISRQKYNGKIIDGRRPIKIEIIKDDDDHIPQEPPKPQPPSLLQRLSGVTATVQKPIPTAPAATKSQAGMTTIAVRKQQQAAQRVQGLAAKSTAVMPPRQKLRSKKGPRRLKKTLEQLDLEMEDYRSHADDPTGMRVS